MNQPDNTAAVSSARILVVDDEAHIRRVLEVMLTRKGYQVDQADGGKAALAALGGDDYDLVILDLRMPDLDGITVLGRIRERNPDQTVLMITAYASVETALEAMKQGAFDYLSKPFKEEEILLVVEKALERSRMLAENRRLKSEVKGRYRFGRIIGESRPMQELFTVLAKVAATKVTVLLTGESGTGKELAARAIHYNSPRADGPFVAVNCAAIPATLIESELFGAVKGAYTGADRTRRGLVEEAHDSTLFLDEVGELPLDMQAKLLRVLQEGEIKRVGENQTRKVDIRVIAATNKDLEKAVADGGFREDLFYRLSVIPIHLPPLRERAGDIPLLVGHFVTKAAKRHGLNEKQFSPDALKALSAATLKGNVRELENLVEQAVIMSDGDVIGLDDLPQQVSQAARGIRAVIPSGEEDLKKVLKALQKSAETQVIRRVLAETRGNRTRAAKRLNISRRALITKIQDLNL